MNHVMQQGLVDRRISHLGLVITFHLAIGAALYFAVHEMPLPQRPPPVVVYVPATPPPPIVLPRQVRTTSQARTLPAPSLNVTNEPLPSISTAEFIETSNPSATPTLPTINEASTIGASSEMGATTPDVSVTCPNSRTIQAEMRYPLQARRDAIQGEVLVQFVLTANGIIKDARIVNSAHSLLSRAALNAVQQFQCVGVGHDLVVEAPFSFRLGE
jgi:periplasmic protein TonB